ncbi:MAG: hypothetical protein H0U66_03170 [Gemmatimonadaceae bacterium]|nr:hypothetical protein [Gemmatimonadaceae bacterium]
MTRNEHEDRKDLHLLEKYIAAHVRRGTAPAIETLNRYEALRARVCDAKAAA